MVQGNVVTVEVTTPLPEQGTVNTAYKIEGTVKAFNTVGAPPWVYAQVQKKDWYKPEVIEETSYERGLPIPISGIFSIEWKPTKVGIYEITIVATPAPLSLPLVGVPPIVGQSNLMTFTVAEMPDAELEILTCSFA